MGYTFLPLLKSSQPIFFRNTFSAADEKSQITKSGEKGGCAITFNFFAPKLLLYEKTHYHNRNIILFSGTLLSYSDTHFSVYCNYRTILAFTRPVLLNNSCFMTNLFHDTLLFGYCWSFLIFMIPYTTLL